MQDTTPSIDLLGMTADVVTAYVSHNTIGADALPGLIASVHRALDAARTPASPLAGPVDEIDRPTLSAIRKSITPDYLVCFEDGRRYKTLKRTLSLKGLTPAQYREKWNLPDDYPMVAPNYSASRSSLAKAIGLGAGGRKPARTAKPAHTAKPARKAKVV